MFLQSKKHSVCPFNTFITSIILDQADCFQTELVIAIKSNRMVDFTTLDVWHVSAF